MISTTAVRKLTARAVPSLALLALTLAGAGCGEPETATAEPPRALQVEVVASMHGQTMSEARGFELDEARFRNALAELGNVADELGRLQDEAAVDGARIFVRVDGDTLLERRVSAAAAANARLIVEPFVEHLRAGQPVAPSMDGVEVRSSALKAKVVLGKIWAFLCGDCGSGDSGSGGGGGIRG